MCRSAFATLLLLLTVALLSMSKVGARVLPEDSSTFVGDPHTARLSNGERFKRGLPPRAPQQLYTPTRVLAPRTSNTATTPFYAEVAYATDPATVIGYLALTKASGGHLAVTTLAAADTYYAPTSVPADNALLKSYAEAYTVNYYINSKESTTVSGLVETARRRAVLMSRVYRFSGTVTVSGTTFNIWDFSDFDASDDIDLTFVETGSTSINLYMAGSANTVYGAASAADVNSAYSTSITENNQIVITLVMQA